MSVMSSVSPPEMGPPMSCDASRSSSPGRAWQQRPAWSPTWPTIISTVGTGATAASSSIVFPECVGIGKAGRALGHQAGIHHLGGAHSAMLAPATKTNPAKGISDQGLAARLIPSAFLTAPAVVGTGEWWGARAHRMRREMVPSTRDFRRCSRGHESPMIEQTNERT